MRHAWIEAKRSMAEFTQLRKRRCENCGAEQTYHTDTLWMRVVRRYWHPKAGRCKPR